MKLRIADKQKAVELRRQGYSYNEIIATIPNLSKSTLSGWLKYINLSSTQLEHLEKRATERSDRGRIKGALTNRAKRLARETEVHSIARQEFKIFEGDPFFIFGLALYWAEGSKKYRIFQFMNSDPRLIALMAKWIAKYLKMDTMQLHPRLYTHDIFAHENHEEFWAKTLHIPKSNFAKTVYKSTPHILKKNPDYRGCLRLELTKTADWLKVMEWIKLYGETTHP